jgi:XTP/dITP diphosphohydrolase
MKLVFVSSNQNKLAEIRAMLPKSIQLLSLDEIEEGVEIEETGVTLQENAEIKAAYIWEKHGLNAFADDTGLEVAALDNAPGVYSARYSGKNATDSDNQDKLLFHMDGEVNRAARFRTSICLIIDGRRMFFEGIIDGDLSQHPRGKNGFGYDPIFIPSGYNMTLGQMEPYMKNNMSHRKFAVLKMVKYLNENV